MARDNGGLLMLLIFGDSEGSFLARLFLFVLVITLWIGIGESLASRKCLAMGYPQSKAGYGFVASYCTRRVNQTDEVLRLP